MTGKSLRKIAFIICVNNEQYFNECIWYINRLIIPQGYMTDVIGIREADSMCSAYQAGMESSDARYKIYLHQDVMIRNIHFIEELLRLFEADSKVGMIGMIGGTHMPKTGVAYRAWNVGFVDCRDPDMSYYLKGAKDMPAGNTIVEAVDGLLIATQYDIPWREDLFNHFDFYDISQSFEMRKAGYQILVPYQKIPWVIHDSGFAKLTFYDEERKKCLKEYSEFLYADGGFAFTYDKEWNALSDQLAEEIQKLIISSDWEQAGELLTSYRSAGRKSSRLEVLAIWYDIYMKEKKASVKERFFDDCLDYQSMYERYTAVCFLLRRMELGLEEDTYAELADAISRQEISCEALIEITFHAVVDKAVVTKELERLYQKAGLKKETEKCSQIYKIVCDKPIPVAYSRMN